MIRNVEEQKQAYKNIFQQKIFFKKTLEINEMRLAGSAIK